MSRARSTLPTFCVRVIPALLLLGAGPVDAATFTVGTTGGCSHVNLQTAVNTAQASLGADTIRVNSETFTAEAVSINTAQELNIIGGHADCSATAPTASGRGIFDGNGGSAQPVLRVLVSTGGIVRLRNLTIRRGDHAGEGEGGGIYFEGNGRLEVSNSSIANSVAGYGAGLYARGTGSAATVVFGANVTVSGNTARQSGGGVYIDQVAFHMTEAGSGLFLNEALGEGGGGFGGGLVVLAKERNAYAYIGAGLGNTGSIFNNTAKYGGGVAIVGDDGEGTTETESELQVHSAAAGPPASIRNNKASIQGGGIYLRGFSAGTINVDEKDATALLWNAELRGNSAPDGAAIYADGQNNNIFGHAQILFNTDYPFYPAPPPGFACTANQFCGGILDNVAQTPDGTPTSGAVVHMIRGAVLYLGGHFDDRILRGGLTVEGNRGGRLIFSGDDGFIEMENVLISDNQVSLPLIHVGNSTPLNLIDVTLAGNSVASGSPVLQFGDGELTLRRSILWQPGRTVLNCSGCSKTFERIIANERTSLDGGSGTQVVVADPRFVDIGFGDYRLRAASPAVDYVPAIAGDDRDTLGLPRDIDLPIKIGPPGGVRDTGAFERQTLQPLVLNSDGDSGIRLWEPLITGVLRHDPLNASGSTGSGSLYVSRTGATPGQPTVAARQCIHLPGPARYELNGWGRSLPIGLGVFPLDTAQLRWELRHNGGETCTNGSIGASGTLTLSNGDWQRPLNPAVIDVTEGAWTSQSSLMVNLVVIENSIPPSTATATSWFDGITLEVAEANDVMFSDGFE